MRKKLYKRGINLLVSCIMATGLLLLEGSVVAPLGKTYFVDSNIGNDNNNGLSKEKPWKTLSKVNNFFFNTGDKILFKAGCRWTGMLSPKGHGKNDSPNIIDMYGSDSKPTIAANGLAAAAVYFSNQEYWEINNLEITNKADSLGDFQGISIVGEDYGIINHFYIKNCYIHDITGEVRWIGGKKDGDKKGIHFMSGWDASKKTGGIVFNIQTKAIKPVKTKFNDIRIENCIINDCSFGGIIFKQLDGEVHWGIRKSDKDTTWYPHTNIIIKNNYLSQYKTEYGCNTIYVTDAKNVVIANNVCAGAGTCAIEAYYADSITICENETFDTKKKAGGADANGIDPDKGTTNIIVQRNYVHDNVDGILVCQFVFGNSIIRYNIIQNNSRYQIYLHSNSKASSSIYNNIFFNDKFNSAIVYGYGEFITGKYEFLNNIFSSTKDKAGLTTGGGITYRNNCYYGPSVIAPAEDTSKIVTDPRMVNPGKVEKGNTKGTAFETLSGYTLTQDSPCINAGSVILNNGGKDFWGNSLYKNKPDIGAQEVQY